MISFACADSVHVEEQPEWSFRVVASVGTPAVARVVPDIIGVVCGAYIFLCFFCYSL